MVQVTTHYTPSTRSQLAKRSWDVAAARTARESSASSAKLIALADTTPDATIVDSLHVIPNVADQLQQLQGLAILCADQLTGVVQRADRVLKRCAGEEQRLAQSVHKAAFNGFADVEQPQSLLRSLVA